MTRILNFSFGSNNFEQMNDRISKDKDGNKLEDEPELSIKAMICLLGHQVSYNKWSTKRNAYVANLVKTGNEEDKVYGTLYELTQRQFIRLHRFEGVNEDGSAKQENGYEVVSIPHILEEGEVINMLVYQSPIDIPTRYSVVDYLNQILKAYLDNHYPKDYIDKLLDVPVVNHAEHKVSANDKLAFDSVITTPYKAHSVITTDRLLTLGYKHQEAEKIVQALELRESLLETYHQRFAFSQSSLITFLMQEDIDVVATESIKDNAQTLAPL